MLPDGAYLMGAKMTWAEFERGDMLPRYDDEEYDWLEEQYQMLLLTRPTLSVGDVDLTDDQLDALWADVCGET